MQVGWMQAGWHSAPVLLAAQLQQRRRCLVLQQNYYYNCVHIRTQVGGQYRNETRLK
jgi:hypothetical protein